MDSLGSAQEINIPNLTWFNVSDPPCLDRLSGHLVILNFWNYSSMTSLHLQNELKRIERRYPDEVIVISVHSPRFLVDKREKNLRAALERYSITFPVAQDENLVLWERYGIKDWPTVVVISPKGEILFKELCGTDISGLDKRIHTFLQEAKARGEMSSEKLTLSATAKPPGNLSYPTRIKEMPCFTSNQKRWALADSGNHQIVVFDDDADEMARFGSGQIGMTDGVKGVARFNQPQGLICSSQEILVADTFNHAIRRIDLTKDEVSTLAGNGHSGNVFHQQESTSRAMLASVTDLERLGDRVFFSNAGTHQICALDLDSMEVRPLAGCGIKGLKDGPGTEAYLAQPAGLHLDEAAGRLYFTDSSTSAIRYMTLEPPYNVTTLVGQGLYKFGYGGGPYGMALTQHPTSVFMCPISKKLWVMDSYNSMVRYLDLDMEMMLDLGREGGWKCADPHCAPLSEPIGMVVDEGNRILVADTLNHRVVEYYIPRKIHYTWYE
ncbi:MAG: redoxin domain-containing protein [Magnetococcales bacterium]|nr:redoxin domain-containing protein [Magnetococcales bacterium]